MEYRHDVLIIGGGAVGCAIAYTLARYDANLGLVEAGHDVCCGTSAKNSGVVHAGFNNRTGSLMAQLCVEGCAGFGAACAALDVPYKKTGKLVVALDEGDLPIVDELVRVGERNGCTGLSRIGAAQMRALEPNAGGAGAMLSRDTAITNPFLYTIHLANAAHNNGTAFYFDRPVTAIEKRPVGFRVAAGEDTFCCDILINAAGLYADQVAALAGDGQYKIYPCRGEYFLLDKRAAGLLGMPLYPVPRPGVGGLGVHLTPTEDGNILIGPSAEYIRQKADDATTQPVLDQLMLEARALMPAIGPGLVINAFAGIRAKLVAKGRDNYGDFIIEHSRAAPGLINLVGIESPGLTASLPIARRVAALVEGLARPGRRADYNPSWQGIPRPAECTLQEWEALIARDPDYGEIVCRCENITRAQIKAAIRNPLNTASLMGIKYRVRAGAGRCQGGYCLTRMVDMLLEEGFAPEQIVFREKGDAPFLGFVK